MQVSTSFDKFMKDVDVSPVKKKASRNTDSQAMVRLFDDEGNEYQNKDTLRNNKNDNSFNNPRKSNQQPLEVKAPKTVSNKLMASNVSDQATTPYLPDFNQLLHPSEKKEISSIKESNITAESNATNSFGRRTAYDMEKRNKNMFLLESACDEEEKEHCTFKPTINGNSKVICERRNYVPINKNWKENINKKQQWLDKQKELKKLQKEIQEDIAMTAEKDIVKDANKKQKKTNFSRTYEKQMSWQNKKNSKLNDKIDHTLRDGFRKLHEKKNEAMPQKNNRVNKSQVFENFYRRQENYAKSKQKRDVSRESLDMYKDCTFKPTFIKPLKKLEDITLNFSKSMIHFEEYHKKQRPQEEPIDFTHPNERLKRDKELFQRSSSYTYQIPRDKVRSPEKSTIKSVEEAYKKFGLKSTITSVSNPTQHRVSKKSQINQNSRPYINTRIIM